MAGEKMLLYLRTPKANLFSTNCSVWWIGLMETRPWKSFYSATFAQETIDHFTTNTCIEYEFHSKIFGQVNFSWDTMIKKSFFGSRIWTHDLRTHALLSGNYLTNLIISPDDQWFLGDLNMVKESLFWSLMSRLRVPVWTSIRVGMQRPLKSYNFLKCCLATEVYQEY